MNNNKGFTLTEVLLAAMIVGIIGIALAALTTAALRESGVGRTRLMLRNQVSLFLRQLRQDVRSASAANLANNSQLILTRNKKLGPDHQTIKVTYNCGTTGNNVCTRQEENASPETVLSHVNPWVESPVFEILKDGGADNVNAVLRIRLVVGVNSRPAVKEAVEEVIMLPHGFAVYKAPEQ